MVVVTAPATGGAQDAATPSVAATPVPGMPSPGAAGIGDPYYPLLGNGGYDATHYTIDLDLDVEAGAIVDATTHFTDPHILGKVSRGLGDAMKGIEIDKLDVKLAERGW